LSIGDEGSTTTTTTNKQEETRSTEGIEMLLKEMGEKERDTFEVAKSYFNLKEFHRAAHALLSFSHPKSLFLRRYSLFLVGAKKREEELNESTTEKNVINEACKVLEQELRTEHNTPNHNMDPLNLYLYGLVLKELNLKERAIKVLIEGLNKYPLNWSCWTEVSTLLADNTSIPDPLSYFNNGIKEHWMKRIFLANLQLELQHNKEALTLYDSIATLFPASTFILSQRASISYNMQGNSTVLHSEFSITADFDTAKDIYSKLFAVDPYRYCMMSS
jgi:anaphase-promoting complex subunit 8